MLTVRDEACTGFGLIKLHGEIGDVSEKRNGDNCCLWAREGEGTEGKVLKLGRAVALNFISKDPDPTWPSIGASADSSVESLAGVALSTCCKTAREGGLSWCSVVKAEIAVS